MTLPRLYPVLPDYAFIERLVPLGLKFVQLRLKDRPLSETRLAIRQSLALCKAHGAELVVNDHWQLAIEEGCAWLHLGQEDLDHADLEPIAAAKIKLGVSTHDHAELTRALAICPDYIALGPIWPTTLKKMKWHEQGVEKLTEWKRLIGDIPLVAIGGLTVDRAPLAFAAGADTVAMVGDLTQHENPEARLRHWLELCA